jgi:tripartite-type tricarboxylate transporter receptor subunit TctC
MHVLPNARQQRRLALCASTAMLILAASPAVLAQTSGAWPTKPITLIVPFPAGGGTDAFARPLSAALTKQLGKQVIIDNKGGAGGTVGAGIAAKAAPDGYTFFVGAVHHAIAPAIYPKLDYDIRTDLIPVALVSKVPQVIVVNPAKVPATNLKELLAYVRANPGKLNYGSAGNGTSHHLAGELFKLQTKTFITHIPYRGAGPALQDLIAGQLDMMFDGLGSSATHIKGGRIKALAVAAEQRSLGFPDIPTAAEQGVPSYQVATWYGLWAPKGTPKELVDRMATEVSHALNGELKEPWVQLGSEPVTLTGAAFGNFVDAEIKRWGEVVRASGAKLE